MRRSLTRRGSRSGGRATRRRGAAQLKLDQPRQHRVVDRLAVEQALALDADLAQQIREQLAAGAQPLHLHRRILLDVVEEVLKGRLDPEVHLPLVRNDAVRLSSARSPAVRRSALP